MPAALADEEKYGSRFSVGRKIPDADHSHMYGLLRLGNRDDTEMVTSDEAPELGNHNHVKMVTRGRCANYVLT
jgi:hypothetical protein